MEHEHLIAIGSGEVEIVQRCDGRQPKLSNQIEHLVLMPDIQVSRGLVQHQQSRALRECSGDDHALLLSA